MSIGYHFAETVIIIEFILVALIVVFTYGLIPVFYLIKKRKNRIESVIKRYIYQVMNDKKQLNHRKFKFSWRNLEILLNVVKFFDESHDTKEWKEIRSDLVKLVIFPLANKNASRRRWISRYYAAKSFTLMKDKNNDRMIEQLEKDPVPLVNLYARKAAIVNYTEAAMHGLLTDLANEEWMSMSVSLSIFDDIQDNMRGFYASKLESETDPAIRSVCYEIMLKYPPSPFKSSLADDIHSTNIKLKISSLKFISYIDREAAIPYLIEALKDDVWRVRLIALHRLGWLKATSAIPQIILCLKDPEWWVKISGAEALKNMGEEGEKALQSQDPELDKISSKLVRLSNAWW